MNDSAREIWRQGLWDNNPGLVQLLGLCPLLAVTGTAINGLGLGLATLFVLVLSNLAVSLTRGLVQPEIRIPVFVLIIATLVTVVDLVMQAWFSGLSRTLGIFIPLIVTNCTILGRAEAFASRRSVGEALIDGLAQGAGFAAVLIALGAGREIVGHGTLMADAHLLLGEWARSLELVVLPEQVGLLLAVLPPGAFIGLGLLIALKNRIANIRAERTRSVSGPSPQAA
ncbi:MAG: electron transport complex subunit E [Wenzhouxiangellaceae bacterium]|nr:electron transport complex subunit E [Wenzhouxiangellaceae bacterium]MBS3745407.1 electron transport complex subunit E [Wenzhouxiangellaceae bacterium]MBS3822817.1 electron transport complex subunit E [Wenzhouxiangellaceae bacterium]